MLIKTIVESLKAKVICGEEKLNQDVEYGFASDLMSDVLRLEYNNVIFVTDLSNVQTIRTAEMSDISIILFARNKKVSKEMKKLAIHNKMVLIESSYSVFKVCRLLFNSGLKLVY